MTSLRYFPVGPVAEFPHGSMRCVSIEGTRLLIANVDGEFFAVDEQCPHEDASLCKGSLHAGLVRCPLHGSRFDIRSGKAMEEPADSDLNTYPVETRADILHVALP